MTSRKVVLLAVAALLALTLGDRGATAADAKAKTPAARYVRFQAGDTIAYGLVEGDKVRELSGDLFGKHAKTDKLHPLDKVVLLVPSARPQHVLALAGNYRDHLGDTPPHPYPEVFFKSLGSLQRHEGHVIQPADTEPVHFEAELVIVIGKTAHKVSEADALGYVLGVTCGNDISARVWQKKDVQWWRAKGSDTFGPCGPYIVTGLDYDNLNLELRVNGKVKQKSNTKEMVHGVAQTVSFISQHLTLQPGDLIFAGTPGKTEGMAVGDVVEVEIEGLGVLRNKIVAEK